MNIIYIITYILCILPMQKSKPLNSDSQKGEFPLLACLQLQVLFSLHLASLLPLRDWMAQSVLFLTQPCKIDHIYQHTSSQRTGSGGRTFGDASPLCCWGRGRKGNSDSHSVLLNYLTLRARNSSKVSATTKFRTEKSNKESTNHFKRPVGQKHIWISFFKSTTFGRVGHILILKAAQAGPSCFLKWALSFLSVYQLLSPKSPDPAETEEYEYERFHVNKVRIIKHTPTGPGFCYPQPQNGENTWRVVKKQQTYGMRVK